MRRYFDRKWRPDTVLQTPALLLGRADQSAFNTISINNHQLRDWFKNKRFGKISVQTKSDSLDEGQKIFVHKNFLGLNWKIAIFLYFLNGVKNWLTENEILNYKVLSELCKPYEIPTIFQLIYYLWLYGLEDVFRIQSHNNTKYISILTTGVQIGQNSSQDRLET